MNNSLVEKIKYHNYDIRIDGQKTWPKGTFNIWAKCKEILNLGDWDHLDIISSI